METEIQLDRSYHLLVVEDESMIRTSLQLHLNAYGIEVKMTTNGEEGVQALKESPDAYDCILMDMNMPVMNGDEAYRIMKDIKPDLKCIIMTGYMNDHQELIKMDPSLHVVTKPFRMEELIAKIKEVEA